MARYRVKDGYQVNVAGKVYGPGDVFEAKELPAELEQLVAEVQPRKAKK